MSGKPTGVVILAILQLLGALAMIAVGVLAFIAGALLLPILGLLLAIIPLIIGFVGLILFYGLWTLKSWAWLWTLIANILTIITSIGDPMGNIIQLAISVIIVIYLFMPGVKSHFT